MTIQKELEKLIKDEVLIEIEDYIDDLFEIIASKKDDENVKEELKHMQEMKKDFEDMLEDLGNNEIDDEDGIEQPHEMIIAHSEIGRLFRNVGIPDEHELAEGYIRPEDAEGKHQFTQVMQVTEIHPAQVTASLQVHHYQSNHRNTVHPIAGE